MEASQIQNLFAGNIRAASCPDGDRLRQIVRDPSPGRKAAVSHL